MKKMLGMLIILFVVYFGLQYIFITFTKGHTVDYTLTTNNTEFKIHEVFTYNQKNEDNSYFFDITWDGGRIPFQVYNTLNKKEKVITQIELVQANDTTCILPILGDKTYTDFLCLKDNIIYNYQSLPDKSSLQSSIEAITNYDASQFIDAKADPYEDTFLKIYRDQIMDGYNLSVDYYKGIYIINNTLNLKMNQMRFYSKDIYSRPLSTVAKDRYITADYNDTYEFNSFILVDLLHSYKNSIKLKQPISFDSYIQGSLDDMVYIIDCANKKQYQINVTKETIEQIGNEQDGAQDYVHGEWVKTNINELISSKKTFDTSEKETNGYERVDKYGNNLTGYYYYYRKNGEQYHIYRANIQAKDQLQYLFTTNRPENVKYARDSVYFLEGDTIRYYNDTTGIRSVAQSKEFAFNPSLSFGVYYKK